MKRRKEGDKTKGGARGPHQVLEDAEDLLGLPQAAHLELRAAVDERARGALEFEALVVGEIVAVCGGPPAGRRTQHATPNPKINHYPKP